VVGMSAENAVAALAEKEISVSEQVEEFSNDVEAGIVISMAEREGGGNWRPGDSTRLVVSKGPQLFEVPYVVEMTLAEAKRVLSSAAGGFTASYAAWGDLPGFGEMAIVTAQKPGSDTSLRAGSSVQLTIQLSG